MKKIFFCLSCIIATVAFFASCKSSKNQTPYYGSYPQQQAPQQSVTPQTTDLVAEKVKDLQAEGFKSTSMVLTMYEQINVVRQKVLANPNLVEVNSEGVGVTSHAAEMMAINGAATKYAVEASSVIKGGMERDLGSLNQESWDAFHAAFIQDVSNFVANHLQKGYTVQKKEGNNYVVRTSYLLNEQEARQVREDAADAALKKIGAGMAFGEGVRKYVQEKVTPSVE